MHKRHGTVAKLFIRNTPWHIDKHNEEEWGQQAPADGRVAGRGVVNPTGVPALWPSEEIVDMA
eukprot:CAMPEP_0174385024 /NCGR_PEP_ID=MMETSP0811_2-20130205/126312_1 /TAXON_ID=73025 ORGANISM="Eutreptiella gymnastica-like, Strain CCMP1594" /NCGR_SAMPLE_ID=MMETSP0811_2 /ASSEMBLY_ACC=CAM_ASM_000667 /LENGTH=62 /DNA_ID=CAMNT_0015539183 /DNA_START=1859 /DNA_END=2043 /DNA_ORIENTATION=-